MAKLMVVSGDYCDIPVHLCRSVRMGVNGASINKSIEATSSESGYILLAVLFLVVLLTLSLATAATQIATDIRRDREQETIHRGMQYARAISMYYKHTGNYPTSVDQLLLTNDRRYLRRRYSDAITGKDDWRVIHPRDIVPYSPFGNATAIAKPIEGGDPVSATITPGQGAKAGDLTTSSALGGGPDDASVGALAGVGLPMARESIMAYKHQLRYDRWQFVYDPMQEPKPAFIDPLKGAPTTTPNINH